MDPIRNPFAPGAGTQPPELAGRDAIRERLRIGLQRALLRKASRSVMLLGLRGVGKTVLLDRIGLDAEGLGLAVIRIEAPEGRSLPAMLAPQVRQVLLRLSRVDAAVELAKRGLRALAGFAKSLKVTYKDIEVGLDLEPEAGLADNGDLEHDLQDLMQAMGEAAEAAGSGVAVLIDELQYVQEAEMAALLVSMHRMSQRALPVLMIGAGLPQLRGQMGKAKSYAERMFDFETIGPLSREAAHQAIQVPLLKEGVDISAEALDVMWHETEGYPYFLQEWGSETWLAALRSPIEVADVRVASTTTLAALDEGFFRVRFDRCTPSERRYLRAMAELGAGPHRSGEIARVAGGDASKFGPTRDSLVRKGMVWSPNYGETAFTVPMFDGFMRRVMPGDGWRT